MSTKKLTAAEIAKLEAVTNAEIDAEMRVDTENRLIGEWVIGEKQSGALTIDLRRLDDVLSGIRLTLG